MIIYLVMAFQLLSGEMLGADLPENYLEVIFDKYSPDLINDQEREIILKAHGKDMRSLSIIYDYRTNCQRSKRIR